MYDMGNKDGFGMMWNEDGRVKAEKSMSTGTFLKDLYAEKMHEDLAVHVRKATFGEKNITNCHPYCVLDIDLGHKIDLYMMHNGTIREVQIDKKMSDSYNFATKFLRGLLAKGNNYRLIQDPDFQFFLAGIIGPNKLVFLDNKKRFTIINGDLGSYHSSGCWVSTKEEIKAPEPYSYITPTHMRSPQNQNHGQLGSGAEVTYEKGEWTADSDLRLHFMPDDSKSKTEDEEADATITEASVTDGTDNGTRLEMDDVDEEGLEEIAMRLPQMKKEEAEQFVIDFHREAAILLIKLTDKNAKEINDIVKLDPWGACDLLIQAAKVKYGTTQASAVSIN